MLSVIIPTYNKSEYLDLTLASFINQVYPDYEIIVVDDGSVDATPEVVQNYAGKLNVKYLPQNNRGRAAARNTGLRHAAGDTIVFNDDDRIVAPNFLLEHAQSHPTGDELVLGQKGRVLSLWKKSGLPLRGGEQALILKKNALTAQELNRREKTFLLHPFELIEDFESAIDRTRLHAEMAEFDQIRETYSNELTGFRLAWTLGATSNMSVALKHLQAVDLFDEHYQGWGLEDTDLAYRLCRNGLRFVINHRALNFHQVHPVGENGTDLEGFQRDELSKNFLYFCRKYNSLESYFFWYYKWAKLDPVAANTTLDKLLELNDPVVSEVLRETYREFMAQSFSFHRIVNRVKANRAGASAAEVVA